MSDLTDVELDALEAAARAATPGPWKRRGLADAAHLVHTVGRGRHLVAVGDVGHVEPPSRAAVRQRIANAEHIAQANPDTVLALVAEVRRLRAAVAEHYDADRAGGDE